MHTARLTTCLALALLAACASSRPGPYTSGSDVSRNALRAQERSQRAAELIEDKPEKAEQLLRQALDADLYYGPAHNNLGVLHLKAGRLYEAANEFEWARKLMPGHPDPRMNLAMTLERAGRIDDAVDTYASALEVYPEHLPTMQALARCQLRHGRRDDRTPRLLEAIALRGATEEWRRWARGHLSRMLP